MLLGSSAVSHAATIELITNGGFEAGLAGWTVTNQANGNGNWYSDALGTTTPQSGFATSGVGGSGLLYAVTDQGGPGTHALTQSFTVTPGSQVSLSFSMFVNDQSNAGPIVNAPRISMRASTSSAPPLARSIPAPACSATSISASTPGQILTHSPTTCSTSVR
jgi:hypothetical protein